MKFLSTLLFVIFALSAYSQNLQSLIPQSGTQAVVEVSGDRIFELISYADVERMLPPGPMGEPSSLDDFGVKADAKAYYFYHIQDNVKTHNVLFSIEDRLKASEIFAGMSASPSQEVDGMEVVREGNMMAAWNDSYGLYTSADIPKELYTMEDLLAQKELDRQGLSDIPPPPPPPPGREDELNEYGIIESEEESSEEMLEFELMFMNMEAPYALSDDEIISLFGKHLHMITTTGRNNSIASSTAFAQGRDEESVMYFWLKNVDDFYGEVLPLDEVMGMFSDNLGNPGKIMTGMDEVTGNLSFGADEIKLNMSMGISPELQSSFELMYNSQLAPAFLDQFNADEAMAYMSFSFDMAAMLKEYPKTAEMMYGSMFPGYSEEVDIAIDLISTIIDEDAIAELITGDGLFVLHDFEEQEVSYKTVEYDADFNATEVEGTRMEPIPTFSVMIGSENQRIMDKAMKIAHKYELASDDGTYHQIPLQELDSPFDMYMAHKNGIVYLTNSKDRAQGFGAGRKNKNLGGHSQMLRDNIFSMYVDIQGALDEVGAMIPDSPEKIQYWRDNYEEMYMAMPKMKDGKVDYDMVIKTSDASGNALQLLLDSMGAISGM